MILVICDTEAEKNGGKKGQGGRSKKERTKIEEVDN